MEASSHDEFREFVAMRSTALLRLAVLLTGGDRHAAEDLLQIALMKAYGRWAHIEQPEAYIRQVMYRQQVNLWRLRRHRAETTVPVLPESGRDADADSDLRIALLAALGQLTKRQRAVVVLRYFEDLPEAEVAALLRCPVGTVRSTAHRSLAKLRALVPELGPEGPAVQVQPLSYSPKGIQA
ncbi:MULTISPECIES: SigE family RNA polymerase sigma factor [unclassified Streptomyces]|uniref:SigE family RNA polymerase sigma factor n=1 Tax=unclassified Streptomyces TaxID=2593676 RepID=UPI002DD9CE28|nr:MULTISPECIES: SigE family RNA polymerase sigma factor [unclassified Streptomyces]WSF83675.1 SigE family RNA polymerase sigma factor [Streptomyces sp. NBC_01744]WTD33262.1 SigE family RNA polymerase sigma factor [Streptomyces sp. NBC_01643]WSC40043.1 SigE family RNA polymerase sigma factor [Streptomyces sp. NBC_01763]WSC48210.1 SigE family RNA polymerase sigma factor [Streptomyces sp. NBC_01762]WSC52829.1 SigE family RNA polymerase sigma factor [Streptomyces sp. NBC_01761]